MDGLCKLTFKAFRENKGELSPISDRDPFTVMLNPESLELASSITYNKARRKAYTLYQSQEPTTITIPTLYFDTTGTIPQAEWPKGCSTVKQMVDKLKKVVYDFDGESHQPPIVKIFWGDNTYTVRVNSFKIKYTLFNMVGAPIRAEVSMNAAYFYLEWKLANKKKSPDLTHLVEVKAGDTLPLMCARVYNNSSYYLQIAKINGLTNFRNLKPGTMLEFPPIRD